MKIRNTLCLIGLLLSCIYSYASPKLICLTGRVETELPSYRIANDNAAKLALKQSKHKKAIKLETFYYNDSPLAPINAYKDMLAAHCSAIVGFAYLTDLKLVSVTQKHHKIPIFTSYATTLDHVKYPNNIFFFKPTYNTLAKALFNYVRNHVTHFKHLIILTEVNRESMQAYRKAYGAIFKKHHIHYQSLDFLENDGEIIKKLKPLLDNKQHHTILMLCGSLASSNIINHYPNNTFLGTENFGSSSAMSLFARLHHGQINAYFIRNLNYAKQNHKLDEFERLYKKTYHHQPLILSAYTYDAVRIAANTIENNDTVNSKTVLKTDYSGVTGVQIKHGVFHRSKHFVILQVMPGGYRHVES